MAETLLPTAMVPGLVTVKDKNGKQRNVYPIDAKELIRSGEYKLVDNGAVQAGRLNANPLSMGTTASLPQEHIAAEITGIAGMVTGSTDEKETKRMIEEADNGGEGTGPDEKAPKTAAEQDAANARESARTGASGDAKRPHDPAHRDGTRAHGVEGHKSGGAGETGHKAGGASETGGKTGSTEAGKSGATEAGKSGGEQK